MECANDFKFSRNKNLNGNITKCPLIRARNDSTKGSFEFKCGLSKIALAYSSKVLHLSYEHGPSNS